MLSGGHGHVPFRAAARRPGSEGGPAPSIMSVRPSHDTYKETEATDVVVGLVALAMAGADKKRSCLLAGAVATGQPQRINKPSECGLHRHSRALDEVHAPVLPVFRAWPHLLFRPH